jgi:flagellar assembly protein FliH
MMNLPSENGTDTGGAMGFPLGLPGAEPRKKDVSRLEFQSVGQVDAASELSQMAAETVVREEPAALESRMQLQADEALARMEAARTEARVEARREWEMELSERVEEERAMVARACEEFTRERAKYFAGVEAEIVKLALAIAARVLHREAQVDPLLLTAAVRVALEKVAEDSAVVLRVPAEDVERWRGVVAGEPESAVRLVGDERLGAGECVLDTSVGRVELGVGAQLAEIERGFFDLLQQRPA